MNIASRARASALAWLSHHEVRAVAALIFAGFVIRLVFAYAKGITVGARGEALNAALGFVRDGTITSAYRPDGIPTAHFLPLPITIAGSVYRLLGARSVPAEIVLAIISIGLVVGSFYLFHRAFVRLGVPRWAAFLALGFLCLVPLNAGAEVGEFRIWDGGYAAAATGALFYTLMTTERAAVLSYRQILLLALSSTILFFINPLVGLGGYACVAIRLLRLPSRKMAVAGLTVIAVHAAFLTPWIIRNERLMGAPIPLRSNFGLELTIAFNPIARKDGREAFVAIVERIHPFESERSYVAMRKAGGEYLYYRQLGEMTTRWMTAHPTDSALIGLRHLRQFLFPPSWLWVIYNDRGGIGLVLKQAIFWTISLLSLIGMAVAIIRALGKRKFAWLYPVILTGAPLVLSVMTQPVLRYRYSVYALSVYLSAIAIAALASFLRRNAVFTRALPSDQMP